MSITYKLELNGTQKQDKTSSILLRITQARKLKRVSTGVFIFKKDFNSKAEYGKWIRRSNPKHKQLNETLKDKIQAYQDAEKELVKRNKSTSAGSIISMVENEGNGESFISYYENEIERYKSNRAVTTYRNHKSKLKNIKEYLDGRDLLFSELNVKFLNDLETHLIKKGLLRNSIISIFTSIRSVLYYAIKEDKFQGKNPFFIKRIGSMRTNKSKLSTEDIRKIERLKLEKGGKLWHTRNYFLFAYYSGGIRIGDLMQLVWGNIQDGRINYEMDKTHESNSTILIPQALEILELYKRKDQKPTDFIFPILPSEIYSGTKEQLTNKIGSNNAIINRNLKDIQKSAKIETKISFHIARHSFADFMRRSGASLHDIKGFLRHSDIKITQNYFKDFDPITSDKAITKAFKKI